MSYQPSIPDVTMVDGPEWSQEHAQFGGDPDLFFFVSGCSLRCRRAFCGVGRC